jgi:hypothetical protein
MTGVIMTTHRKSATSLHGGHAGPSDVPHPRSVPTIDPEDEIAQETEPPFGEGARDELDPDLRHRMISEAAYRLYEERGYADGYDVDDWQQAEAGVDHLLLSRSVLEK